MKYIPAYCPVFLLLITANNLFAQSIDAQRYVNAQGVEVIQSRPQPKLEETPSQPSKSTLNIKENINNSKPLTPAQGSQHSSSGKLQISTIEQGERDRERLAILNQELMSEVAALQTKSKILHSPTMKAKLSEQELQRLQETTNAHEQNIRALNSEISRATVQVK